MGSGLCAAALFNIGGINMSKLEDAIERIKILECPTGDIEKRLVGILENYEVANKDEITIKRDKYFDRHGVKGYEAKISNHANESIIVLAKPGLDDYVAKVIDVYIS